VSAAQERELDVLHPLATRELPVATPVSASSGLRDAGASAVTEDDFVADMQAILSGQKVFDPATKRTVEPERLSQPATHDDPPTPDAENAEAIFDRIARSMTYANAYDLGTVELENRFADFDRVADHREHAKQAPKSAPTAGAPMAMSVVGRAEVVQDLDEIRRMQPAGEAGAPDAPVLAPAHEEHCACGPASRSALPADGALSRPFFDAGEHMWPAADLYDDRLRVGASAGVPMSYGHIIAMADLYETVDEMMTTSVAELTTVKRLIDRNLEYYRGNRSNPALDVSHEEWNKVTGGRYLRLADDNFAHFTPENRSAWQEHHARAIEEAGRLWAAPENANRSVFPEWPLIINAFGDHFLTDAFASGHLISKTAMVAEFKRRFFAKPGDLNGAGESFFERVAEGAFVGKVRQRFSVLETVDYPVCVWGWCLKWHPNIDTVNAFRKLLVQAAEQEPDKVANFVVKALHDRLNREGVQVTNRAGDTWRLMGDGRLDGKTLEVMGKAVRQSADNLDDPSTRASNLNFGPYFEKVWRYVPTPTPAEAQRIAGLVREYTDPASRTLSAAAATLITEQVDSLISVLIEQKKLKPA
jgi:hypothetical protein